MGPNWEDFKDYHDFDFYQKVLDRYFISVDIDLEMLLSKEVWLDQMRANSLSKDLPRC